MSDESLGAWRCSVCGYVHREPEPPESCPVCGAPREEFEPYREEAPAADARKAERWRCQDCGYVHSGSAPPDACPACGAPAERFEPITEPAKRPAEITQVGKVVVVGAGIAGVAAVESLRGTGSDAEVTLISQEAELPYYRLNLTRYLAGEVAEDDLRIHPESWYQQQNVRLLRGTEVADIALDQQFVALTDGHKHSFDKLVLTAGAHPFVPPFTGAGKENVTCLRTLGDARSILEVAKRGVRCVCIGGGILGLETAGALVRRGGNVAMLENEGWLLPRQLNQRAGQVLEEHVIGLGIKLYQRAGVAEILGDRCVHGVRLDDGTVLPADLVVIATGIRPNIDLAQRASLTVNQGVIVNDLLATSHPNVLAAGDVAEHRGTVYGLWVASQFQGNIAGMNAVGIEAEFGGIPRSNSLKVLGLDLFSIGLVEPAGAGYDVIDQENDGQYFRFVFCESRLVGAILLGDMKLAPSVKRALETSADFSDLLRQRPRAGDVMKHLAGSSD